MASVEKYLFQVGVLRSSGNICDNTSVSTMPTIWTRLDLQQKCLINEISNTEHPGRLVTAKKLKPDENSKVSKNASKSKLIHSYRRKSAKDVPVVVFYSFDDG